MKQQSNENNIPKHWQVKKLGEICERISNGANAKQSEEKIGYPISRIETIWNETIDINRVKYVVEDNQTFKEKYTLKRNDILFSHINSDLHLGKTAIYKDYPQTLIHGINLLLIRIFDDISSDFVNYQFKYKRKLGEFINIAHKSVNQSSINQTKLKSLDFVLPPLTEQLAIVSKIEELLSDLENGKQQLLTAQQQLKVYRQSLLKAAFEGRLTNKEVKDGKLPEGWKWMNLGNFIDKIEAGKSFKCDERTPNLNEVGVLKVSAVTWQIFNEFESKTVFDKDRVNDSYLVKEGDFLFSRANTLDLIGAAVVVNKIQRKLMLSDKTLRFIFNNQINKYYALYYLRSQKGRREIQRLSTGNQESMRNIGQARINQIEIPIPPTLDEQHQIVEILESKLTVCDNIEETISQSLQQAETLKQSILKKAFEGKLV